MTRGAIKANKAKAFGLHVSPVHGVYGLRIPEHHRLPARGVISLQSIKIYDLIHGMHREILAPSKEMEGG